MKTFDAADAADKLVRWIQSYFEKNGPGCKAVIGISGGKDSSTAAAACVKALGKDRVVGVLMPSGTQGDIDYSYALCSFLDIESIELNIGQAENSMGALLKEAAEKLRLDVVSKAAVVNTPPRLRMTVLYAVAAMLGGRVVNNCNLSEDWVGYSTKFGDAAGDFSPLCHFTVAEVKEVGRALGLPDKFVEKTPLDGLCGKTDEENLGFRYEVLDRYIREGICLDQATREKIDDLHAKNLHKLLPMPQFVYESK